MKKQSLIALGLLLLIPVVTLGGGTLANLINPESAAGHPNYVHNFQLLSLLKASIMFASLATAGLLWLIACLLVIRSKKRSLLWLLLAALGPLGFAVLAALKDPDTANTDRYAQLIRRMNVFLRGAYEVGSFILVWVVAYQAMVLYRALMIRYEAATTGASIDQIVQIQNASSGMWAFGEGLEVMYLVVVLYVLRPVLFNLAARIVAGRLTPQTD